MWFTQCKNDQAAFLTVVQSWFDKVAVQYHLQQKQMGKQIRNLCTTVYTSKMARTAAQLWQNTFRTIPYASFFDADFFFEIWLET